MRITSTAELKSLERHQLTQVAAAVRERIIKVVSRKGGHLGANLGTVELTVALHYVFQVPRDVLVWDVGHQAYAHKLLTGRWDTFETNRDYGGLSGFPKRSESEYDLFGTGHSSTALSAVMGMALADRLRAADDRAYLAVVGDASLGAGMALEALNHLGASGLPVLLVYNDNAMGIDPGVGTLQSRLANEQDRLECGENPLGLFDVDYRGPVDGHDLDALVEVFQDVRSLERPVFLHIRTVKGKGLEEAERSPVVYHAPGKFEPSTGLRISSSASGPVAPKFQDVFGQTLVLMVEQGCDIVGVTAAMPTGTSLKLLQERFPERTIDVGIAEQHAVTLSAGMATRGIVPYCAIYSTFFQRAYDQVIHDVALQGLKVIFCLDRAGLVGEDGPTHHGAFDISSLLPIPGLTLCAPLDEAELTAMLYGAYQHAAGPVAIRYPRGRGFLPGYQVTLGPIDWGRGRRMKPGRRLALLSFGTIGQTVRTLLEQSGEDWGWYDLRFAKPLDMQLLEGVFTSYSVVICLEEGSEIGGVGSEVARYASEHFPGVRYRYRGLPDDFIPQGPVEQLQNLCRLDVEGILSWLMEQSGDAAERKP